MARFTKALRQQLVRDFAEKNGGWFDPAVFLSEVRKAGEKHPAYGWFEWDDGEAAHEFRLDQARDFARGLKVVFEVQTMNRGTLRVVEQSAPMLVSPMAGRKGGGGYFITDPDDPAHMIELCLQAAQSMRWFISRYEGALRYAGINTAPFEKVQAALEDMAPQVEAA